MEQELIAIMERSTEAIKKLCDEINNDFWWERGKGSEDANQIKRINELTLQRVRQMLNNKENKNEFTE